MTTITGFMRLVKTDPVLKVPNSEVFEPYLGNKVEFRKSEKNVWGCPAEEGLCKISAQSVHCSSFASVRRKKQVKGL